MSALLSTLPYLIGIAAGATAVVLFIGMFTMAGDGDEHAEKSNVMMRWRVGLQGLTLALIALYFLRGCPS